MSKNIFISLLFMFFSIFQLIYSKKKIIELEGDSFDIELEKANESRAKLFIIFHIKNCPYCVYALKVLKDDIITNYKDEDEITFATINLDKQSNVWLGVRFNITRIPYVILIENKKMYNFQNQFEKSVVLKFIEHEKDLERSMKVPDKIGTMYKINAITGEFTERLRSFLQIFFNKFGLKVYWNNTMSYILLTVLLIVAIYFENKLILFVKKIFKFDRNENNNGKNNEDKDGNDFKNKNEKAEEKEDERVEKKEK